MINTDAIKNLPRSEIVFLNVFTHTLLFPATYIKTVEVTEYETVYSVRIYYESMRTQKKFSHCFNFFKHGEAGEAKHFIELLSSHYPAFTVVGDEIAITN